MKLFTIYYEHHGYGYYSTNIEADSISEALEEFVSEWAYKQVYGIMQIR